MVSRFGFGFWVAWCLALVIALPVLWVGPFSDDFMRHLVLEGQVPHLSPDPLLLYDFTRGESIAPMMEQGYVPWQTHPDFSLRFFRPLSSLLVATDHMIFGRAQLPAMMVNVAWFLGLFAVAVALLAQLLPPGPARLAAVIYALTSGHAQNLGWVSSRHLLIGGVFALLAVCLHVASRDPAASERRRRWGWASPLVLVLAMLSSESFLAGAVFIVAYELVDRSDSRRTRLRKAAPTIVLCLVYVVAYPIAGYGTHHSGLYISPFAQPRTFLLVVVERWPFLLGELAGAFPSAIWTALPEGRGVLYGLGLAAVALVFVLLVNASFRDDEYRRLRFLALAAAAGCLPLAGGVLNGRMLTIPSLASSALIAWVIHRQWSERRAGWTRWLLKAGVGTLVVLHLVLAPAVGFAASKAMADLAEAQKRLAENFDERECRQGDVALLLTGSDPSLLLAGGASLAYYRPELISRVSTLHVLSMAPHDLRIYRKDATTLDLELTDLPRRTQLFEGLFNDEPLQVGDEVAFGKLAAKVRAVEGGLPTRVRFRIPQASCLLMLDGGRLVTARPPAPGETLEIAHEPGPFGL